MTFKETVKEIKNAEKNVDKVLKAAKLQRTPKDDETLLGVICIVGIFALMLAMIVSMVIVKGGVL